TVDGTTNGGGSWSTLGTLGAPIANDDPSGVTEIRFADALHGYAFLPSLWATVDGGATWTSQTLPGGSNRVLALAGDADAVYAVGRGGGLGTGRRVRVHLDRGDRPVRQARVPFHRHRTDHHRGGAAAQGWQSDDAGRRAERHAAGGGVLRRQLHLPQRRDDAVDDPAHAERRWPGLERHPVRHQEAGVRGPRAGVLLRRVRAR